MNEAITRITPAMQNYILSIPMVGADHLDQSIDLGQRIVRDLDLVKSVDTLARWMIQYLSQQIVVYRQTSGKKRKAQYAICEELAFNLEKHLKPPERPRTNYDMQVDRQEKIQRLIEIVSAKSIKEE